MSVSVASTRNTHERRTQAAAETAWAFSDATANAPMVNPTNPLNIVASGSDINTIFTQGGKDHACREQRAKYLQGSSIILRQLLVRAAQRLRDDGFYCRRLEVDVKWLGRDRDHWTDKRSFSETQDTSVLLHVLQDIWQLVPNLKPLRVGVALTGLAAQEAHQPDLFEKPRNAKLVQAIDSVNEKFGKGAVTYGGVGPDQKSKIAFQRVPKAKEF